MKQTEQQHWDDMYKRPLADIPWEIESPPPELTELIKTKKVAPGAALDIGSGTGNYAQYLAKKGFTVIGIDFSRTAVTIAREHAAKLQLPVTYIEGDITKLSSYFKPGSFDLILDYSILHHIDPALTDAYAGQCATLLKPGGVLLLVCYSDNDQYARGQNRATGKYGNQMYYRSVEEIRHSYKMLKELRYKETFLGKRSQHAAHCFLFQKPAD